MTQSERIERLEKDVAVIIELLTKSIGLTSSLAKGVKELAQMILDRRAGRTKH